MQHSAQWQPCYLVHSKCIAGENCRHGERGFAMRSLLCPDKQGCAWDIFWGGASQTSQQNTCSLQGWCGGTCSTVLVGRGRGYAAPWRAAGPQGPTTISKIPSQAQPGDFIPSPSMYRVRLRNRSAAGHRELAHQFCTDQRPRCSLDRRTGLPQLPTLTQGSHKRSQVALTCEVSSGNVQVLMSLLLRHEMHKQSS